MAVDVQTTEPRYLTAGDTWTWKITLPDYLAGDGWVLSYALASSSALITISSSASGDDHLVEVAAAATAAYSAGDYEWQSYVTLGSDRYSVDFGTVTVRPNLAVATSGYDSRSPAKKALDAINTYLETGNLEAADVQIDGRAIKNTPVLDLYRLRDKLKAEVANESYKARAAELGIDPRRFNIRLGVD